MNELNENSTVAVTMQFYGLDCVILTPINNIEEGRKGFNDPTSEYYLTDANKKKLFKKLMNSLHKKDKYYKLHPERMNNKYQAWNDFCDDCIILTALGSAYRGNPIFLMNPDTLEEIISTSGVLENTVTDSNICSTEGTVAILHSMGQDVHFVASAH